MKDSYPKWLEILRAKAIWLFQRYSLPRWMVFGTDNLFVFLTFLLAYILRYNFEPVAFDIHTAISQALIAVAVYASFGLMFRSYSGLIRHTTITDIFLVLKATTSSIVALLAVTIISRQLGLETVFNISISILLIHYVTITLLLFFIRIITKIIFEMISTNGARKNVLIFGAGAMGVIVKRVINSDIKGNFRISGFLDHKKKLQGKKLNGIPVYNPKVLSPEFVEKNKIKTLIIAIADISPARKGEIIRTAMSFGLEILESPPVDKWLNGQPEMRQLQKVKLNDLLGRDPIKLDLDLIGAGLNMKVIMVTGAAGSIGSEIVRQLAGFNIRKVILVDQAETPMFHLGNELRKNFRFLKPDLILADVTNEKKMELIFQKYHPDIVFHASAYKHVPLLEDNPHEALRVNAGGTRIVTGLAEKYGVTKFVMISTDKAVNPANVMGASKRLCEMIVQSKTMKEGIKTQFVITRFGNVLGSNGSVVPEFSKQIEEGGPITVTHPDITRYFMTIPEACQLVLEAGFLGNGGEIFVFDMGKPIKIADLANNMIRLSGLEPGKDIKIVFTGLRPGEKLYEELLSNNEMNLPTHHRLIKIAHIDPHDYSDVIPKIDAFLRKLYNFSNSEVVDFLMEMVPEYKKPDEGIFPEDHLTKKVQKITSAEKLLTDINI
jgi:FlaA1/EpsC-like NDP-sugar epimerase